MSFELKECTEEDLLYVSERLRDQDEVEVRLLHDEPVVNVLMDSVAGSDLALTVYINGTPAGVGGVARLGDDIGAPWMLGTPLLVTGCREWLHLAPDVLNLFHSRYPLLTNIVHNKNTKAIRWLKRMGFVFHPSGLLGTPEGFTQFTRIHYV